MLRDQTSLVFTSKTFSVISSGGQKFLNAQFDIANKFCCALRDLTLVAYHQGSNQAGTSIKNLQNFAGLNNTQLDAYAQAIKPTNGMSDPIKVDNNLADLQVFTEAETMTLQTDSSSLLQTGEYLFPYGFVARASSTSRTLATGEHVGTLTLGVKVPDNNEPNPNAERFRMTFIAFIQPVTSRVTESLEEQGTTNANTRKRNFAASDVFALGGSSLLSNPNIKRGCIVRTAGGSGSPLAYLVKSFELTGFTPNANANTVMQNSNIDLTLDQSVNAPAATDWVVRGNFTGIKSGMISGGGSNALSFNVDKDFMAGELVTVLLKSNGIAATSGDLACVPGSRSWQFRAAVTAGGGTFGTKTDYPTGGTPESVVLGDVNGDAKLDMITANYNGDTGGQFLGSASVFLGNGDGTFRPKTDYPTGNGPTTVVLGDLNGDGKLDMITTSINSEPLEFIESLRIFLGNGDGTFKGVFADHNAGFNIEDVALGDVNGDSKLDIIIAISGEHKLGVLLGNGDGTFQSRKTYATGSAVQCVALGDVNSDMKLDIVAVNYSGDSSSVFLGNGDGTFQPKVDYTTGPYPSTVVLGDVNSDSKLDMITTNDLPIGIGGTASVFLGNGDGTFRSRTEYPTGSPNRPKSLVLGDVNGDTKSDIITANFKFGSSSSVLLGNGDGTFQPRTEYPTGDGSWSVAVGDVNGDAKLDIVTANYFGNSTSVLLNK